MEYCPNCECESCQYQRILAERREQDARDRAAGNPPSWTPERRARHVMVMWRPEVREKMMAGVTRYQREKERLHG